MNTTQEPGDDRHDLRPTLPSEREMASMREWLRSFRAPVRAANDETPAETHKKMWLELVAPPTQA